MMLRIGALLFFLHSTFCCIADVPRNLLQNSTTKEQLRTYLLTTPNWTGYPAYQDRTGWDALMGTNKMQLISEGEKNIGYVWKVIPATAYLEYERSGNRVVMENPYNANTKALLSLLIAELAEGKGRFMDAIIDGVWSTCDMSSWVLSAHLPVQRTHRNLPEQNEVIIDLVSGDMGSLLSWTWYFFHQEFDKVNPAIAKRIHSLIESRLLNPYLERSDYWWQALDPTSNRLVNNWNPWCNSNVLLCFLLMEQDPAKKVEGIYKTMVSTDKFINYVKEDGACEEGPSYWGHAAGKLYDYLQVLYRATNGRISLFENKMIKDMGEYIARSYVGKGWVVNFADAAARYSGDEGIIFRYGKAVGSQEMCAFAAQLFKQSKNKFDPFEPRDFFRTLENILTYPSLLLEKPSLPNFTTTWYPQTEFCYMRTSEGLFVAAKGGFNNESHNHNDVGTFSLYVNETPFFVDAGVGTYTRQTFSAERYDIWTMQSDYHNLPMINGVSQRFGAQYKAAAVTCNTTKQLLQMNIAGAYPAEARVKKWQRTYALQQSVFHIYDVFELDSVQAPNRVHFLTWAKPTLLKKGLIELIKNESRLTLAYNPAQFEFAFEVIPQTDKRLSSVWGQELFRIVLTSKIDAKKGRYDFTITANKKNEHLPVDTAFVNENIKIAVGHLKNLLASGAKETGSPRTAASNGQVVRTNWKDWTSGFFPGSLWYAAMLSGDTQLRDSATSWTEFMEPLKTFTDNHDIGFMLFNSFGNAYRFTQQKKYLPILIEAARSLSTRFNATTQSIKSWNSFATWNNDSVYRFPVIIDNMMNLRLLFFASKISGDTSFKHIALTHAKTAMANQIRPDYSSWHVVAYDTIAGKVMAKLTAQGYADQSTWARGQAWGIYGYTETYRETGDTQFLRIAQGMANYYLDHPNLPADLIPYWDFYAGEPGFTPGVRSNAKNVTTKYRDASAAAITCSALFELSRFGGARAFEYYQAALTILRNLSSPSYRAPVGTNGHFILKHSVTSIPHNSQIDVPLVYADYYFLEALYRYAKGVDN